MQFSGKRGWRFALALALASATLGAGTPALAQYLFGGPPQRQQPQQRGGGGFFGNAFPFFQPFQQRRAPPHQTAPAEQPRVDYSRAPPPQKSDEVATRNILVLGDGMADWLAYGLEDALSETPELGIIREVRAGSGLIRYQARGEPSDWVAAAKGILAKHSPEAIVVMLGLSDRLGIRETVTEKKSGQQSSTSADIEGADDEAGSEQPHIMAPERGASGTAGNLVKFRDEKWAELYGKKIDAFLAVLKSKGVPVIWVGLPAVLGTRSTSEMSYLDGLLREAAARADVTYVDVWDGFVDEAGRFTRQGPDFEGQIRRLRSADGVYFTQAGARKLAHYAEREIMRLLAGRSGVVEIPIQTDPSQPAVSSEGPAARPLVGPIVPLVAASISPDRLLGGPDARPAKAGPKADSKPESKIDSKVDAQTTVALLKGEALTPPAGRADDYAWPRREIALEKARGEAPVPVAVAAPTHDRAAPAASRPRRERLVVPAPEQAGRRPYGGPPVYSQQRPPPRQAQRPMLPQLFGPTNWLSDLFNR